MEDLFYDNWLSIGLQESKYKQSYPIISIKQADSVEKSEPLKLPPGFFSRYANRLRNGRFYGDFKIPANVYQWQQIISGKPRVVGDI